MCIISFSFYLFTILIKKTNWDVLFYRLCICKRGSKKLQLSVYVTKMFSSIMSHAMSKLDSPVITGAVVSLLISDKGVAAFNTIQITSSVLGYVFNGLTVVYVIYILKRMCLRPYFRKWRQYPSTRQGLSIAEHSKPF